jgi:hypothetical protein
MDGVHDCSARPADAKLANALAAWTAMRIGLGQKDDVQRADIGVYRDMVAGEILAHEGAIALVDDVFLHQRRTDAP